MVSGKARFKACYNFIFYSVTPLNNFQGIAYSLLKHFICLFCIEITQFYEYEFCCRNSKDTKMSKLTTELPTKEEVKREETTLPTELPTKENVKREETSLTTEVPEERPVITELPQETALITELPEEIKREETSLTTELPEETPVITELPQEPALITELPEETIPTTEVPETLITELPTRYSFYKDLLFVGKDFAELTKKIIKRAEILIKDIELILHQQKRPRLRKFTIGKTYAPTWKKPPRRWKVEGISNRWYKSYEKSGYDFLLAFAVVTIENVSCNTKEPFNNQQMLALALESQLIQHFCYVKEDSRLGNTSLDPGHENAGYAGQVLYIAVRFSPRDGEDQLDE